MYLCVHTHFACVCICLCAHSLRSCVGCVRILSSLLALQDHLSILESAKKEIDEKVRQRQVALERWFSGEGDLLDLTVSIDLRQRLISRLSVLKTFPVIHVKKELCRPGVRRSQIVKARNARIELIQSQLNVACSSLALTRMSLLRELANIYSIEYEGRFRTIRGLALPSISAIKRSNDLRDEETISTALGHLLHRLVLSANIVDFPILLVPQIAGSRSTVRDPQSPVSVPLPLFYKVCHTCIYTQILFRGQKGPST